MRPIETTRALLCNLTVRNGDPMSCEMIFHNIEYKKAIMLAKTAQEAFRDIQIIASETGEVLFNQYWDAEVFVETSTLGNVVAKLDHMYRFA